MFWNCASEYLLGELPYTGAEDDFVAGIYPVLNGILPGITGVIDQVPASASFFPGNNEAK
jgi:hypothetical protein